MTIRRGSSSTIIIHTAPPQFTGSYGPPPSYPQRPSGSGWSWRRRLGLLGLIGSVGYGCYELGRRQPRNTPPAAAPDQPVNPPQPGGAQTLRLSGGLGAFGNRAGSVSNLVF